MSDEQEGEGKRMRPRIFKDKKGNSYIKHGNKRIVAKAGVTDAGLVRWLIKRFAPKRKKRAPRVPKAPVPVHSQDTR